MHLQTHSSAEAESVSGSNHSVQRSAKERSGAISGPATFDFAAIAAGTMPQTGPIAVSASDREGLLAELEALFRAGQGFSLATLNLDHLVKIGHDPEFRRAYAEQTHVTADGNPVVWLCRLAGQDVSLVPGSELVEPVAALAARCNVPVAMVGSTEASLDGAAAALKARNPGLNVVAQIAPPMGFDPTGPSADAVMSELRVSGARMCFLALGAPKQEIFAARAHAALPEIGFLSIGAGLDFLSGAQTRAPAFARMLALEWFWRLMGNPRRFLARYAACFAVLPPAARAAWRARRNGSA